MGEDLLLMNEQRKWFIEMESISGKGAMKIAEMTTKDLDYFINLFHKPVEGFERIDSNIEQTSNVGKVLLNSIAYYRKIVQKRKYQLLQQTSGCLLRNCYSHPSHEIKRCLSLGRKAMTNLDSTLQSRGITLPTKVRVAKALVFPVVIYRCESWTIKRAECQRIDAFELSCWRRLLRVPWTARRSSQSILKEISPECSLKGLMLNLKLQYFGYLM